jgi:hypothetical protein
MLKGRINTLLICILFLAAVIIPTACSSRNKNTDPPGPTATVIDDETGNPIEGAVAIAIWSDDKKDCKLPEALEGGCFEFRNAVEAVSGKDGGIYILGFWKTTDGQGGSGNRYDPRLTVYKFGYVCWDQQRIFHPTSSWEDRKDFNRDNRIVRLKKWPEDMNFRSHSSFMSNVTSGNIGDALQQLFNKERMKEGPYISKELEEIYSRKIK